MEPSTEVVPEPLIQQPPDHTQLPDEDGKVVHNFQEHPQSRLLTESLEPHLDRLHPDGQYCIGADNGIYWRYTQPPLDGCKAPDWFYVPGVPPLLNGQLRRSYVLWQEVMRPTLVIEYVSGDGREERDTTTLKGKFWVYERAICAAFYAIFEVEKAALEVYRLEGGEYRRVAPNEAGRFPIEPMGIELGIWEGSFQHLHLAWLRAWDAQTGELLPVASMRANEATRRAEIAEALVDDTKKMLQEEVERAENERRRADKLAERLRALGVDPNS